jgi:hypothetical protein
LPKPNLSTIQTASFKNDSFDSLLLDIVGWIQTEVNVWDICIEQVESSWEAVVYFHWPISEV